MSKQTSRQSSKQGQNSNKQSGNQNVKQTSSANKQVANASVKQSVSATKTQTRQAMKRDRREEEKQRQLAAKQRAARNKRILIGSLIAIAVLVVAGISYAAYMNTHKSASAQTQATPTEQIVNAAYPPVDGIYCDALEQTAYHHHVHLTIYINGQQVPFPAGMGIAGDQTNPTCYYWLHTHATDGVIHIEAPSQKSFSLKNFLDIWQSFAASNSQYTFPTQLALPDGWTMYVNGKKVPSDFSKIDISSDQAWHELITLMYNSPNAKPDMLGSYNWPAGE
ncbi:MAG TPA: hypothetical protein VED37_04060 [Ktedonobacteraceae bacterium]|nr:hypothetical protein [Ktedonobacteraceae bacterium]